MPVNETSKIYSSSTVETGNRGNGSAFNSESYKLQTNSVFTQANSLNKSYNTEKKENAQSKESIFGSFKNFLKWNLTGGIAGSLVRGELGDVIEDFKKETGLNDKDLLLCAFSPSYGALKIAANKFMDEANEIYNEDDDSFGEVSTNLDFES